MTIIKWLLILNIFFNFLLTTTHVISKNLEIPKSIEFELSNSEYNKYLRRSMRAYTDGELYGKKNIKKKYKKWVKAKIKINQKKIDAQVRILGDLKDHLRPPQTSLKVKTIGDSYYGITRFNLYLPETRKGENEVFWTLMLKYLKFPSLYTRMVDVNFNGEIYKAILQEDATKEFLERNNLTETVIIKENDFNFYLNEEEKKIYDKHFSSSFVIDNNKFIKNDVSNFIVSEAISLKANVDFEKDVLNENLFKNIHNKYASHALTSFNRKYIYIPYKKIFLPLYYDGNIQFLPGKTSCNAIIDDRMLINFKKEYNFLTNKKLSKIQECVFKDTVNLVEGKFKNLGDVIPNVKTKKEKIPKYSIIKSEIINFLQRNTGKQSLDTRNDLEKHINYTFIYNDEFFSCSFIVKDEKIKSCKKIDSLTYSKYISESGRFKKIDNFKSFPINLGAFNNEIPLIKLDDNLNEFKMDKKATYYFIAENKKDKDIKFIFQNNESKLFIQGHFSNINFEFTNIKSGAGKNTNNSRYDKNLLTGCANFFDSYFENISIKSSNMLCEDSINIKNSKGNIRKIEIRDSSFDGIDLDFSKITIDNLFVNNAQNDCIDFSFGEYKIEYAELNNCGDKGLSVGERSKLDLNNGFITKSNIGIASKDDSITTIDTVKIDGINVCLSAYNKKKEFKGSTIEVRNMSCTEYQVKKQFDELSTINIIQEN